MGKVTVFELETCPHCLKAKDVLRKHGVTSEEGGSKPGAPEYVRMNVTAEPWRRLQLLAMLDGPITFPRVFFGDKLIGGGSDVQELEEKGELAAKLSELAAAPDVPFPPPFERPSNEELLKQVPAHLQEKWQLGLKGLDSDLGGGISSLLVMVEGVSEMIVLCTDGEPSACDIYKVGAAGEKGSQGGEEKLYCQVALEKGETVYVDDPSKIAGLEKNEDFVKFGYGYYIGAPWKVTDKKLGRVPQLSGTVAVMEKVPDKLQQKHVAIVEKFRDMIQADLEEHAASK